MGLSEEEKEERGKAAQSIATFNSIGEDDYVFISYKSDDWKIVLDRVVRHMVEKCGLRVYFDKNFNRDNDIWVNNMKNAIATQKCRAVLAFVSKEYMTSYACLMELLTARSIQACIRFEDRNYPKLQIIPIIIDGSGSVEGAMSKSGERVYIKEKEMFLEILEDAKKSPWVQNNKKLMSWLDQLANRETWTKENLSHVAEIILNEGHNRIYSENIPDFYDDLRYTIKQCSEKVFDPSLIKKETAASYLDYWTGFQTHARKRGLSGGLRFSKAGDHNWYALWLDSSTFRIECSVNTRRETLRTAFFVQNAPDRFIRLEQAKTAIETALEGGGEIVWDGRSQAANISVFGSRQGKSTEEQYEWFCHTAEKLYAAVSPYLG